MVIQYKCPNCGGNMLFNSESGLLTCESCGNQENIQNMSPEANPEMEPDFKEEACQYQCQSCGAVLITDKTTAATNCVFCGAAVVLGDRLSGILTPSKVLPFRISKEQAEDAFKGWCKKGCLTPKGFYTPERLKNITGIYVPFWLYDLHADGEAHATCTKTHYYSKGDYNYTETKYYDVYRKIALDYHHVPTDASEKMDDHLMDQLEPFPYEELKIFQMPYLAGYLAEKYSYTDKDLFPRVNQRIKEHGLSYINSTIHGYSSTVFNNKQILVNKKQAEYALLPVWMLYYHYKDKDYIFAMNGQTGKIVGKFPLSFCKISAWFFGISAVILLLFIIITLLTGGVLV